MKTPDPPPSEMRAERCIEIVLRRPDPASPWQAEMAVDGRQLHFGSLATLIDWLARVQAWPGGIR